MRSTAREIMSESERERDNNRKTQGCMTGRRNRHRHAVRNTLRAPPGCTCSLKGVCWSPGLCLLDTFLPCTLKDRAEREIETEKRKTHRETEERGGKEERKGDMDSGQR